VKELRRRRKKESAKVDCKNDDSYRKLPSPPTDWQAAQAIRRTDGWTAPADTYGVAGWIYIYISYVKYNVLQQTRTPQHFVYTVRFVWLHVPLIHPACVRLLSRVIPLEFGWLGVPFIDKTKYYGHGLLWPGRSMPHSNFFFFFFFFSFVRSIFVWNFPVVVVSDFFRARVE
jgi:hypothetical protein